MLRSRQCVGALAVIAAMTTHGQAAYTADGDHPSPNLVVAILRGDGPGDDAALLAAGIAKPPARSASACCN